MGALAAAGRKRRGFREGGLAYGDRRRAALIQTYGGSRRIRNRAGHFVAPPCITIRSLYGVKVPVSSEEKN